MNTDPEDRIKTHHGWNSFLIWWIYGIYLIYFVHIQLTAFNFITYMLISLVIPIVSSPSYLIAKFFAKPVDKIFNSLDSGEVFRGMMFGIIELGIYFAFNLVWTIFLANLLLKIL